MTKLRVRKYLKIAKPCVKGSILVLFGIFNSRSGIGVEIFTINLIYGPLAYLFLAFSGIMVIKLLQIINNPSSESKISLKQAVLLSITLYFIGLILILVNVVINLTIYYLNIPIILLTIGIGIFWFFLGFYGFKNKKSIVTLNILIVVLIFSIGLIYGAFLNTLLIPIYLYFFFLLVFFLQLTREVTKGFIKGRKIEEFMNWEILYNQGKILKYSLGFEFLAIIFLIFSLVSNISYSVSFLFLMICGIFVISFAIIMTLESILEKKVIFRISTIIKIDILIILGAILILGS
ncbi:MAG: hypothetical protein ACFE9I_12110 [Candidatus Hermodarchaeota archaeon]